MHETMTHQVDMTGDRPSHMAERPVVPSGINPQLLKKQQAVVAMGRRAVAPPELDLLLHDAASLIAELLDVEHYLVAECFSEDAALRLELTSRQADESPARIHRTSREGSESLAGFVLQVAHPVAVENLADERRFQEPWLVGQGMRGALAVPLVLPDRAFGALIACSSQSRRFSEEDLLFAETIAHLVTTTIARGEAEKNLEAERTLAASVLQAVGALVLVLDRQGRIRHVNRACERISGFSLAELKDQPIWETLSAPDEVDLFQLLFQKLLEGVTPVEYEGLLLTKHSDRRNIAWSCSAVPNSQGGVQSIIATGLDITEQRRAEAEVKTRQAGERPGSSVTDSTINQERRRRPRRSYPYRQSIAPVIQGAMPPKSAFVEIECNDIAAGGFSFLSPQPPPSNSLIVALGVAPKLTYLKAEIVHVRRVQNEGRSMYLIGCSYIGRVDY